jgi:hypothetical protein
MRDPQNAQLIASLIAIVLVIALMAFRMRKMMRQVPLKLNRLWIGPVILVALAGLTLAQLPPQPKDWIWLALALTVGAGLGWQRARLMNVSIDPADKSLKTQASPMAIYFLIGLVLLRTSLRAGLKFEGGIDPLLVNDSFIMFGAGLFIAQNIELSLRARRLLAKDTLARGSES